MTTAAQVKAARQFLRQFKAAFDFAAAGVALIAENPLYIRVITSGGTGTDVTVILCTRKK